MSKATIDSLVAGGLVVALLLVIGLDKLLTKPPETNPPIIVNAEPAIKRFKALRLAVSQTSKDVWDDMGKLLDHLGEGYRHQTVPMKELYDPKTYDDFDVLFLTCSREGNEQAVADNVRDFVARGGTLYASDWRFLTLECAFPDMVKRGLAAEGRDQELEADIVDSGLHDAMAAATVRLKFDLDHWKTAAFGGDRVKVLMKVRYKTQQDGWSQAPLLVKFPFGKGSVIFTSFHNETQNNEIEKKLLKYLVFSAVTAQMETEINQTMIKGGFSPQKSNLLSASGRAEVAYAYQSAKAGKVRFILGFQDQGARLRLTVVSPDGRKTEREGTSTIQIEETSAAAGAWRYTVTALAVPYPDFPFTLTVGEAQ